MADRSIVVRLRAEVADYLRGMRQAQQVTDQLGTQAAPRTSSALDRMVESARANRQEWSTVGRVAAGAGGAILGVGAAALRTGVAYNTLQQTSRAALATLVGSAEAANEQMDRLDEFATTSPFAKDVFIRAQQQMLGFGIESRKVIPYLDAIQNAVAATGGSNQDIAELARVISQVAAAGKLTAVHLMQFGQRGIDAAELIGSRMGKTGQQIRESITAGTLDARVALDALAEGMEARYAGAAANVKGTVDGAADRVKAAWRDLSAELAAPFVDPKGGGLLVDWLNSLADAMRGFQSLPGPVKATAVAIAGVAGAGLTLGGAAMMLIPRLVDLYDSLGKLGPMGERAQGAMRGFGRALPGIAQAAGGAAVALLAVQAAGMALERIVGDLNMGTNELRGHLDDLATGSGTLSGIFGDVAEAGRKASLGLDSFMTDTQKLREALDWLADPNWFMTIQKQLSGVLQVDRFDSRNKYAERLKEISAELTAMAADDLPRATAAFRGLWEAAGGDEWAGQQLLATMPEFRDHLIGLANAANLATDDATLLRIATGELVVPTEAAARAAGVLEEASEEVTSALQAERDALNELIEARRRSADVRLTEREATRRLQEAIDKASEAVEENGRTLDITTEKGRANEQALDGIADAGWKVIAAMQENGATQAQVQAAMAHTRESFIEAAESMGLATWEAEQLANRLGLIPSNVTTYVNVIDNASPVLDQISHKIYSLPRQRTVTINQVTKENVVRSSNRMADIGRASGGILPGAPSSVDNLVIRAASGEFVVNARATQQHRQLLEAINRNALPAYATGGYVAPARAAVPVPAAPAAMGGFTGGDTYIIDGLTLSGADLPPGVADFFRDLGRHARQRAGVR